MAIDLKNPKGLYGWEGDVGTFSGGLGVAPATPAQPKATAPEWPKTKRATKPGVELRWPRHRSPESYSRGVKT